MGDRCLLIGVGDTVDPETSARVFGLVRRLKERPIAGVFDIVPAFTTVALHYRPELLGAAPFEALRAAVLERLAEPLDTAASAGRSIDIPVCYGGELGPDLADVAAQCGLTTEQVIERHMQSAHRIYMLGFAPGFPFIGGLDPALKMPRRSSPRTRIPPGSVGIARDQSCVYPLETPGGWNLIGRTPVRLFDPAADPPCLLAPGDRVRFVRIDEPTYQNLLEAQP
ncbi:5-oxoprolinase subunit PxpB [Hydrogenophaga crassostreae]|uniref:5-oxoprolinase subunit PxpB n=1 Tax=Hydrogenophaga crassostreae TaxID=1763535 RepID=UPI001E473836|nr:5-oxoprolinase subunit PxpB [Hydrogenophaga crassostreae]